MPREGYWDYMGRRMTEDRIKYTIVTKDSLEQRIEALEREMALLKETDSRQLELDV